MIAAAVIAGILALAGSFIGGYYLGRRGANADVTAQAVKDEAAADKAADAARAKIEADEKEALAKVPGESVLDEAKDLWGDGPAAGGVLVVEKEKK